MRKDGVIPPLKLRKLFSLCYYPLAAGLLFILLQMIWTFGIFYIGHLAPLSLLAALTVLRLACAPRYLSKNREKRIFFKLLCWVSAGGILASLLLTGWILLASYPLSPDYPEDATVLVLGCQVNRDGTPSKMLRHRLEKAAGFLEEHPHAVCITSGGQGANEPGPEAIYMRDYLLGKGIEENRIYCETQSVNTGENILFSKRIIEEEDLNEDVVIVTDGFHQLRARYLAARQDLSALPLSSRTPWYLLPMYLLREHLALIKAFLFGV